MFVRFNFVKVSTLRKNFNTEIFLIYGITKDYAKFTGTYTYNLGVLYLTWEHTFA